MAEKIIKTDFPKNYKTTTASQIRTTYQFLIDKHMHISNILNKKLEVYLKWLGIFVVAALILGYYQFLTGIIFAGIISLFFILIEMSQDFRYDKQLTLIINEGKRLEEEASSEISFRYFHQVDKFRGYKNELFLRLCFPGIIFITTAIVGIIII